MHGVGQSHGQDRSRDGRGRRQPYQIRKILARAVVGVGKEFGDADADGRGDDLAEDGGAGLRGGEAGGDVVEDCAGAEGRDEDWGGDVGELRGEVGDGGHG